MPTPQELTTYFRKHGVVVKGVGGPATQILYVDNVARATKVWSSIAESQSTLITFLPVSAMPKGGIINKCRSIIRAILKSKTKV